MLPNLTIAQSNNEVPIMQLYCTSVVAQPLLTWQDALTALGVLFKTAQGSVYFPLFIPPQSIACTFTNYSLQSFYPSLNSLDQEPMPDPLSTVASVIALCQATIVIFKGFQIIANLPKAPAEFHDLLNEVRPGSTLLTGDEY